MRDHWLSVLRYFGLASPLRLAADPAGTTYYQLYPGRSVDVMTKYTPAGPYSIWRSSEFSGARFRVWSRGRTIDVPNWGFE